MLLDDVAVGVEADRDREEVGAPLDVTYFVGCWTGIWMVRSTRPSGA